MKISNYDRGKDLRETEKETNMTSLYLFFCETFPLLHSKMLSENVLQKEIALCFQSDYNSQADLPLIFWKKGNQ